MTNNVEESQHLLEQDMDLNGASSVSSSSLSITHLCLMAKDSKVSPTLNPNISHDDDDKEENDNDDSIHEMGKIVLHALSTNKIARDTFLQIMSTFVHRKLTIELLESQIDEKYKIDREDAMEKASLENALVEEQELRVSLEEKLESLDESNDLIVAKIIKERDHALAKYKVLKKEKVEFGVGNARLVENIERLDKAHKALESEHSLLIDRKSVV